MPWVLFAIILAVGTAGGGYVGLVLGMAMLAYSIEAFRKGWRSPFGIFQPRPSTWRGLAGGVAGAIVLVVAGAGQIGETQAAARREEAAAEQQKQDDAAKVRASERAAEEIATRVSGWRATLDANLGPLTAENLSARQAALESLVAAIEPLRATAGGALRSPDFARLDADLKKAREEASRAIAVDRRVAQAKEAMAGAIALVKSKEWLQADVAIAQAITVIQAVANTPTDLAQFVPPTFKAKAELARMEQLKAGIASQVKAVNIANAAAKAYAALCGEKPTASPWDGEMIGLESALARGAHDPDSIDVENCTEAVLTNERCWRFTCGVRGKNAFGALVYNEMTFYHSKLGGFESQ